MDKKSELEIKRFLLIVFITLSLLRGFDCEDFVRGFLGANQNSYTAK